VPELGPVIDVIRASSSGAIGQRAASASEFADQLAEAVACTPPAPCEEPAPPPSTWVDALIGRVIGERYRVEEVIGRGTTSVVFRARHLELGSPVAVKVLSPSASGLDSAVHDRFRFEAQVLAGLRHPNIISVLDLGTTDDGLRYIAMELLKGETLAALIEREKRLEPTLALRITAQIAEALTQLHERGLIHRDVKPPNIFVVEDSTQLKIAKLMDFGLARAQDGVPSTDEGTSSAGWEDFPRREQHTQRGIILGTGAYMSPELIQNGRLDARSDVYALAVVAYRMLTGVLPFSAKSLPQLLSLHLSAPVEPLHQRAPEAGISAAVERAILRALAKSPADRPESAGQFAMELRAASDESPGQNDVGASPTGTTPPAERSNGESPSVKAAHIQSPMLTMDAGSPQPFEVVRASSRPVDAQPARGEKDLEHASVGSAKAELDSAGGVAVLDDEAHSNPEESAARSPLSATPTVRSRRQWVSRVTVLGIVSAALILASYAMFVRTRAEPARVEAPGTNAAGPVLRHADQTAREEAPPPATVSAPAPQPPSSTTSTTTLPPEPSARRAAHGSAPDTDKGRTTRTKTKSKRKSVGNADELKTPLWR
jgi:serine/threonine protein kinase